jgi:hypothetical protein
MSQAQKMGAGDDSQDAMWAATSLDSGRFDPIQKKSSIDVLRKRFAALDAAGAGYLEIRRVAAEFPLLTLGFRGSEAVVQVFRSVDEVAILKGPGTSTSGEIVIPLLGEEARFDSWAGVRLEAAWDLVEAFLRGAALESAGTWAEL